MVNLGHEDMVDFSRYKGQYWRVNILYSKLFFVKYLQGAFLVTSLRFGDAS